MDQNNVSQYLKKKKKLLKVKGQIRSLVQCMYLEHIKDCF